MRKEKKMNDKGFSLVELIIVIAIMAILIGVLAPQFIKYVEKSRVSKDIQNLQSIKTAIEVYAASNEGLSSDVTVTSTISSNVCTVKVAGLKPVDLSGIGTLDGTSDTKIVLDSKNWTTDGSFKYDKSAYTWSTTTDCTNGTGTEQKKMSDVFK